MKFLKNIKPRKYQTKIFETCRDKNCLVVLPTGLGKTLIALMLSIERMEKYPDEKILFLAPTRPLAEQHLNYFKKHLPELFATMVMFTGKIIPKERKKLWATGDIIFSTPQCISNDLKNNLYNLEEVSLLIEDEAHRCIKNYAYNYISHKYTKQAKHQRILGLTASPGNDSQRIKKICYNLSIREVELRTRDSPDVKEYLQEREFEKINLNLTPKMEEIRQSLKQLFDQYVDELKKRRVLYAPPSKTELIKLQNRLSSLISRNGDFNHMKAVSVCAQAIKIQHALELIETQTLTSFIAYLENLQEQAFKKQSKGVIILTNKPEFNFALMSSKELLRKGEEHPKLKKILEIIEREKKENLKIIIFTQYRETAKKISEEINTIVGIKAKVFVGQAKKKDTGLSQKEQRKIIEDFSEGKINVLCATSIAEEGLDIPEVNAVVFYEPIPSAIRAIQRAGRTARLRKGKLIILITKGTRDESFYYVSRSREKKMHSAIKDIKEEFERNRNLEIQKKLD